MPPETRTVQLMTKHVVTVEKKNHFAKMCCSATSRLDGHTPSGSPTIIHHVTSGPMQFKSCTVKIYDVCIPLLLDTGASVSLLNASTYHKFFHSCPLSTPTAVLHGYGDSNIYLVGSITVSVRHGTGVLPFFVFNVARRGGEFNGTGFVHGIGIYIPQHEGAAIMTVAARLHQRWASLFEGLGCLSALAHQPTIDPSVTPVVQRLNRIPLALRDGVSVELQLLLDAGIIELVDASPWISNLVVVRKKSGALHVCVQ